MSENPPLTSRLPFLRVLQTRFRKERVEKFLTQLQPQPDWNILDVGGTTRFWKYDGLTEFKATLLNRYPQEVEESLADRISTVVGSGLELEFEDKSFDLAFSNSVIEHVGSKENQEAFAREASRVGKRVWVQTPAQEFFLEPHYMAPFIHWLPKNWRRRLARHFTLWGLMNRPSKELIENALEELNLLTKKEMIALFPDCEIIVERFWGMPKSYIAFRK